RHAVPRGPRCARPAGCTSRRSATAAAGERWTSSPAAALHPRFTFRPPDFLESGGRPYAMGMTDPRDALRAWFLGPRAENADLLERLVTEALRDHVFWRRNYHPEDGFTISERDRRAPGYDEAVATLTQ